MSMTEFEVKSELKGLVSALPDSFKPKVDMKLLSDGKLYVYYEETEDLRELKEFGHYLAQFVQVKAYIKSITEVERLKASIKYLVEFN